MDNLIGKPYTQLDTPCLIIDKNLLLQNIHLMQNIALQANKNVRPHAKTHKCSQISKLQIAAGAIGCSVTKVSEAKQLIDQGLRNILITSPVVTPLKIEALQYCLKHDPNVIVVIDNLENAIALDIAAKSNQQTLKILVDIDPGVHRTGIADDEVANLVSKILQLKNLNFLGIQCYAGNVQHIPSYHERKQATLTVMQKAAQCLKRLQAMNIPSPIFTGSGTGTFDMDMTIPELTEIQPGSYTVMDSEYYTMGSQHHDDRYDTFKCAMRLLTTVISANHTSHVTCDAGWKALYQVPTPPIVIKPLGLFYQWGGFGDEHGKITATSSALLPKLGEVIEIMVAHCDPTINLFDEFYIVENGIVTDIWPIDCRGKSQ